MIVTAGTSERLAENRTPNRVQLFVCDVHASFFRIVSQQHLRTNHQKARCDPLPVSLFDGIMRQQVSRDLLEQELAERHVGVDRVDHPITISPRFAEQEVLVQSV